MRTLISLPACCLLVLLLASSLFAGTLVRVGAYENPPKVLVTPEGRVTGIFPELLDAIAHERDWQIEYVPGSWEECLARLESGQIDLMVDVALTEERKTRFAFSQEPVLVNWGTIYSRNDLRVDSFEDLRNRSVAVMRGSVHTEGEQGIKALTRQFGIPCHFLEVENYEQVLMLVDSKQADLGVVNRLFGALQANSFELRPSPLIFNPRLLQFAAARSSTRNQALLRQIDQSLATAKSDPVSLYHEVLAYYLSGGEQMRLGRETQTFAPLDLSPAQRVWIAEHPVIRYDVDPGFAPFESLSEEGKHQGMSAEFLELIAQLTGLEFKRLPHASWPESVQALQEREIDLLPCLGYGEERRHFLAYSEPYLSFARVIVTRMDSPVQGLQDLDSLRVAVQRNSSHHAFLREETSIEATLKLSFEECLLALSRGEVDAVLGNLAVATHVMQNRALSNLKLAAYVSSDPQPLSIGVRKDWPELTGILNKALKAITPRQRNAILAKWLPLPRAAKPGLELSQEEREWLLMHPRIRVAWDPGWAPVEFADAEGNPQGISIEHLKAAESLLGVRFELSESTDWQGNYKKLQDGELDMSSCLAITPDRMHLLEFTDSYLEAPVVYFTREEMPYLHAVAELQDLRVAVVSEYATEEWLHRDCPELPLRRVESLADGFELLAKGEVDVFLASVLSGNYYLSQNRFRDLKIAGESPYCYKLRMAVRKDWPLFRSALQKALRALPEADRRSFYRKWVWLRYEHGLDYTLALKVLALALVVILVFLYWNRRLRREVQARKRAQAALAEREQALRKSYAELKELEELKENLTHMIVHDIRSPLSLITGALDLMEMSPEGGDANDLNMARAGAQRVTAMAQSLLDICRLEEGRLPLHRVKTNLRTLATEAIEAMRIQALLSDVRLQQQGQALFCKLDPDIMHRVLVNLLTNAIQASPGQGAVLVSWHDQGEHVVIEVRDRGRGIPASLHDTLFEKFTTVETSGSRKTSIGLGLAFCRLAVEAHGGEISVESVESKGSTFRVLLPCE